MNEAEQKAWALLAEVETLPLDDPRRAQLLNEVEALVNQAETETEQ